MLCSEQMGSFIPADCRTNEPGASFTVSQSAPIILCVVSSACSCSSFYTDADKMTLSQVITSIAHVNPDTAYMTSHP
jgi:hypothetical protein